MSNTSVIVVGAGAIGTSVATHLCRLGASVTLVTEKELCSGASSRSLSWLNSASERSQPYHDLRMAGIERYRTLASQQPALDWLRFDGGLRWQAPDLLDIPGCQRYEANRGYQSQRLATSDVGQIAPDLSPTNAGPEVLYNPGEGWVSLPHLIAYLIDEFKALGGKLIEHAGDCSVTTDGAGKVTGIHSSSLGELSADQVVLCCGPRTSEVVGRLGVHIPDDSPLSMLLTTQPSDADIKTVLNTPRVAMRPDPGQRFVMDHSWYEDRITELPDGEYSVEEGVIDELLGEANALLGNGKQLQAASFKAGRKPIPGDGEPVVGELSEVPGCHVAFTHSGATLALIVGELLADEVVNGYHNAMLESFRPERFKA